MLPFFGGCLREGGNWANCRKQLLESYFPYFVRERLITDLIVFKLHKEGESVRGFADQIFEAASFLEYQASEEQLVERILMNLHPTFLTQAVFVQKPVSRRELYLSIGTMEEKIAVAKERSRTSQVEEAALSTQPRERCAGASTPRDRGGGKQCKMLGLWASRPY
jgi:hypothetical protein